MKKYDIITIGSATQDTYVTSRAFRVVRNAQASTGAVEQFAFGTKIELDDLFIEVGGGATNAAATFHNFHFHTSVVSRCGDDPTGLYIRQELQNSGIDTSNIRVIRGGKTGYGIFFLGKYGERTILVYRGVSGHFTDLGAQLSRIATPWAYVSSLGGDMQALKEVFSLKRKGAAVAWNPGKLELALGRKKLSPFLRACDILLCNLEESQILFGKVRTLSIPHIRKIMPGIVVVTSGANGSRAFIGNRELRTHIKPVHARDTTGAGDSFGSGFVAGLMTRPGDFHYALYVASANAMSNVLIVGAKHGLIRPPELPKFKNRISIY